VLSVAAILGAASAGWLLAGGAAAGSSWSGPAPSGTMIGNAGGMSVRIETTPPDVTVRIDGMAAGRTPLELPLAPGEHALELRGPALLDTDLTLTVPLAGSAVHINMWRRQPDVVRLRPAYPGAILTDLRILADGQLALLTEAGSNGAPERRGRELRLLNPASGRASPIRVTDPAAVPTTLALAPDGVTLAYATAGSVRSSAGAPGPTPASATGAPGDAVWIAPTDPGTAAARQVYELPAPGPGSSAPPEQIIDLIWLADGQRLLVIARQPGPPARSRLVLLTIAGLSAHGNALSDELALLPTDIVPGSVAVAPGGQWATLLARAAVATGGTDRLALCVIELQAAGQLRDLADAGGSPSPTNASTVAWAPPSPSSTSHQLVFVGPAPPVSTGRTPLDAFGLLGSLRPAAPPRALFVTDLSATDLGAAQPRRLGTSTGTIGPIWPAAGVLYGFARQGDGGLALRSIDRATGDVRDGGVRLPPGTGQGSELAVQWDAPHGRPVVLAREGTAGPLQAWLVSFVTPPATATPGTH
jgi:hypothetical protein